MQQNDFENNKKFQNEKNDINNYSKNIENDFVKSQIIPSKNKTIDEITIIYKKPVRTMNFSFNLPQKHLYGQIVSEDKIFGERFCRK